MLNVIEKENLILVECRKAYAENKQLYIYGAAEMGKLLYDRLIWEKIPIAGFVVDTQFYKCDETYKNIPILSIDDLNLNYDIVIIVAMKGYDERKISQLQEVTNILVFDITSFFTTEQEVADYSFIEKNKYELENLYQSLADDKSREHMTAYLNQKISGDFKYLKNIWEENQYYDNDIVPFSNIKTFVDCGAFDGDSYFSFLKKYKEIVGEDYNGKAYLFEPDQENYDKLSSNCGMDKRSTFLKIGAWNEKDCLTFSTGGTSSGISEDGYVSINVDSIDNIVHGKRVDFIKMDIEGSELKALEGAKETIRKCKPILAICIYHKMNDFVTIPQYIKSLCKEYKLYIRAYSKYAQELVLYAICG